ncbi:MAG TPA: hypothetical protein VGR87_05625 [Candidatus Limnocylindria bacterium]|nr:hypothetical protein [Candidatus Limnocylindria bacterium]
MSSQSPSQAITSPAGSEPGEAASARRAYSRANHEAPKHKARLKNIHPMGCPGRRPAISAPTTAQPATAATNRRSRTIVAVPVGETTTVPSTRAA